MKIHHHSFYYLHLCFFYFHENDIFDLYNLDSMWQHTPIYQQFNLLDWIVEKTHSHLFDQYQIVFTIIFWECARHTQTHMHICACTQAYSTCTHVHWGLPSATLANILWRLILYEYLTVQSPFSHVVHAFTQYYITYSDYNIWISFNTRLSTRKRASKISLLSQSNIYVV